MNTTEDKDVQAQEPATPKRDYRQEVTNQIIEMLEKGTAPWQKPWEAGATALPFNPTSDRGYRGGNALHLMATAARKGFTDPRWLTYRQAQENGWQVRQGEKGTQIEYWQFGDRSACRSGRDCTRRAPSPDQPKNHQPDTRPLHRVYTVFNAQQIDGIPPQEPKRLQDWEVVQTGEEILQNSGAASPTINTTAHSTAARKTSIHLPAEGRLPQRARLLRDRSSRTGPLDRAPIPAEPPDAERELPIRRSELRQGGTPGRTHLRLPGRRARHSTQPRAARGVRRLLDQRPEERQA